MARPPDSFNRYKSRYKPQPTVLIICEDSKSGLKYLQDASGHFRVEVKVEISHCGRTDPKGIVEHALARQKKFDCIYCVIDRDAHPSFNEAIGLAMTSSKIKIIASYPCFEFWLMLHFKRSRKPYNAIGKKSSAYRLIEELRKISGMENYDKGNGQSIFESLIEKLNIARSSAAGIFAEAVAEQEPNPSTMLHLLLDDFEELSKPQPLT